MTRNRGLSDVCRALLLALLAGSGERAFALGEEFTTADPPPPVVKCTLNQNDITATSFAGIFGYQFKGSCTVHFPGTNQPALPAGKYEASGSWNSSNGMVNELLKGNDKKGQPWEMKLGGSCKLDPWILGGKGASCDGSVGSRSSNAPAALSFKKLGFPVSASLLDGSTQAWLAGRMIATSAAEAQAPKFIKPDHDAEYPDDLPLSIDAGPGSPTKTFTLEWAEKVGSNWSSRSFLDQSSASTKVPRSTFGDGGEFRVRARAHQIPKSNWSDWREFRIAAKTPKACGATSPYGAKYEVTATPPGMNTNETKSVSIGLTNTGLIPWPLNGNIHLSYHWVLNGVTTVADGQRTSIAAEVPSCGKATVNAKLVAPAAAGVYTLQWDMVNENITWFSTQGVPTGNRTVNVQVGPPAPAKPYK